MEQINTEQPINDVGLLNQPRKKNLIIIGATGTGKSLAVKKIPQSNGDPIIVIDDERHRYGAKFDEYVLLALATGRPVVLTLQWFSDLQETTLNKFLKTECDVLILRLNFPEDALLASQLFHNQVPPEYFQMLEARNGLLLTTDASAKEASVHSIQLGID